jgi:ubiquinone/menaquinone biosynthesis C-methylase UbiE
MDRIKKIENLQDFFCLDVGCGGNPFPNANVLCDFCFYEAKEKRGHGAERSKIEGKPFVLCDAQFLPFRNNAFDFIHCAQMLEHVDNPQEFVGELERVGKHGYIETPSWFWESIFYGDPQHKWVVKREGKKLYCQPSQRRIAPLGHIFHWSHNKLFLYRMFEHVLDEYLHALSISYTF